MTVKKRAEGNIGLNISKIIAIAISLCWLPIAGPFISGFIGCRKMKSNGEFLIATGVAALTIGLLFYFLANNMTAFPVIGAIARKGSLLLSLSLVIPLIAGCMAGYSHGR